MFNKWHDFDNTCEKDCQSVNIYHLGRKLIKALLTNTAFPLSQLLVLIFKTEIYVYIFSLSFKQYKEESLSFCL